jgi:penicillin-binding protein 1A
MARAYNAHSGMNSILRWFLALLLGGVALAAATLAMFVGAYFYVEPGLPHAEQLRDVRFQIPLRVYSRDGRLIQQIGSQHRTPVEYEDIPQLLINALIAAEDDRFFEHSGLDMIANARAAVNYVLAGGNRVPGGSTITQQVAREYFLTRDLSLVRKFREWILALRIEAEFSKHEILELFFNTTFFGQRSYGVAAAAQTYFGKTLDGLTLSEAAILAGIPQRPSRINPVYSPAAAINRRAYVLRRMRELRFIDDRAYDAAMAEPVTGEHHGLKIELDAPYVAEMARAEMVRRFGQAAYTAGLRVTTTVDSRLQAAAQASLRRGVIEYDERHGYRGPLARLALPEDMSAEAALAELDDARMREVLADYPSLVGLEAAVVTRVGETDADVFLTTRGRQTIEMPAVAWARPFINDDTVGQSPRSMADVLAPGDIVRFRRLESGELRLAQLPDVQAAFVALDPKDGAIVALTGGFDFYLDNYNRATQAKRQPGSSFKPFIYSAALENGFNVASIVNDAPLTIEDRLLETTWKPENYTNQFYGPVSLRYALMRSLNAATVRVILDAGVLNTVRHLRRFGFDEMALPANASLALGSGGVSPLDLATGYAVFANGGFRVRPYFIDRVHDAAGEPLYVSRPAIACADCDEPNRLSAAEQLAAIRDVSDLYPRLRQAPRAVTPQNAFLVADMMKDVVGARGTGARARRDVGRDDIAGKTGTTNDNRDAWFAGFHPSVVGVAWVGFNLNRSLGRNEQGGVTAIPIWAPFMQEALEGVPRRWIDEPPGIVEVRVNPKNGLVASGCNREAVFEKFRIGQVPEREPECAYQPERTQEGVDAPVVVPTDRIF